MRRLQILFAALSLLLATAPVPAAAQSMLVLRPGTYQEHHPYMTYHGNWEVATGQQYTDDAAIFTTDANAWMSFTVLGPAVTLFRTMGPGYGSFELCLNNDPCTTISNESMVTSNRMPVLLRSELFTGATTITLRAAGGNLNIDQIVVDPFPSDWPIPTPWPTPNATPFINTWDEGTELALHIVNAWGWVNQNRVGPDDNSIQIFDALAFIVVLGAIFSVLASTIRRAMGGRKSKG